MWRNYSTHSALGVYIYFYCSDLVLRTALAMKLALRHVYTIYTHAVYGAGRVCIGCNLLIGPALSRGFEARLVLAAGRCCASVQAQMGKTASAAPQKHLVPDACCRRCNLRAIADWLYIYSPPPEKLACCAPHNASGDGESKVSPLC
jgi:hypothetical protein